VEKTVEEIESNDEAKKQQEEQEKIREGNKRVLSGCLIGLIFLLGTCGVCMYSIKEVEKNTKIEEAAERSEFDAAVRVWENSSVTKKPGNALAVHLKHPFFAEAFYFENREFRKSTNYVIRLLKFGDPEEFIEFCRNRKSLEACN
jgi:hypothetical protein